MGESFKKKKETVKNRKLINWNISCLEYCRKRLKI